MAASSPLCLVRTDGYLVCAGPCILCSASAVAEMNHLAAWISHFTGLFLMIIYHYCTFVRIITMDWQKSEHFMQQYKLSF